MAPSFRYKFLDAVLSLTVLSPLTVLFYVTIVNFLDRVFLVDDPVRGAWILLFTGITVETSTGIFQNGLQRFAARSDSRKRYHFAEIGLRYVIAFANVSHIRSLDVLLANYVGSDIYSALQMVFTTMAILIGIGCFKCILNIPIVLSTDTEPQGKIPSLNNIQVS